MVIIGGCLGELLSEPVAFRARSIEVGLGPFGADTQGGARLFECGKPGIRGGVQRVTLALGIGADAGDFLASVGLGSVGALDGGGFGLLGWSRRPPGGPLPPGPARRHARR